MVLISIVLLLDPQNRTSTWQRSSSKRSSFLFGPSASELTLDVGSTIALVGPSGAGKTTVLRAVAGLVEPRVGSNHLRRRDVVRRGAANRTATRRAEGRVRLPGLRAVPAHDRSSERRVRASPSRRRIPRALPNRAPRRHAPRHAVRRRAAARCAGPRTRTRPRGAVARRAALGPRCAHEDRSARRASAAAPRTRPAGVARDPRFRRRRCARRHGRRDRRRASLRQTGTPRELVAQPTDPFVASFTGANLLRGVAGPDEGTTRVRLADGTLIASVEHGSGDVVARRLPVGHHPLAGARRTTPR